jgi:hypothetical protein
MRIEPSPAIDIGHAATDKPVLVVLGERRLLAIDGVGRPEGADYRLASEILRSADRRLRERLSREHGIASRPGILETAWWPPTVLPIDELPHAFEDRSRWHWVQMCEVPARTEDHELEAVIAEMRPQGLRAITFTEGPAAQMLHIGGEASMASTLRTLFDHLASAGLMPHGRIHELLTVDERGVPPGRARSILRMPIEPHPMAPQPRD